LGNNIEADLQYRVDYCEINNKKTCKIGLDTKLKSLEINNLINNLIYTYHIHVFGSDKVEGPVVQKPFKTSKKG
jgi:hypothetical protein